MAEKQLDYQIKSSRRKSAAIHVTPQGVEVRVPHGIDRAWVHGFVASKRGWIEQQQRKLAERLADQPALALGEHISFLGRARELRYQTGSRPSVRLSDDALILTAPAAPTPQQIQAVLEAWFKQQAKAYFPQHVYARAQQLGVMDRLNQIRYRRTKTKWGHCTSEGNLQFNWQILGAPEAVVDYLICHEVSHLLEHNHSKRFWAHVASLCPHYQQHRQWLRQKGHTLIWC